MSMLCNSYMWRVQPVSWGQSSPIMRGTSVYWYKCGMWERKTRIW